jgi:5-methyltetrahydrofolate--homocysteine methyltransferase
MIIIGEKINGFIPKTAEAISAHDDEYIKSIAVAQSEKGADYLDICAGTAPELERETLKWLIELAQGASDVPLCLDSSDPQILLEMIPLVSRPGILNSISLETGKCEAILPAIANTDWKVIALTCDDKGITDEPEVKLEIATKIIAKCEEFKISHDRVFIDPLVTTLATKQDSLANFTRAISLIKSKFPDVHFTSGLSNISFGMPYRKAINMQFLALAMAAGMDSAIMDPLSGDIQATLFATDALLGNDEYCMGYLQAYRAERFGLTRAAS